MRFQLLESGKPLIQRSGDFLLVYDPGTSIIFENLREIPKYPIIVGKYIYEGQIFDVAKFQDFTERAELGPLRIYDWDFLDEIGAERYGKFWEYYARLELYLRGKTQLVLEKPISERVNIENFGKLYTEAFKYLTYDPGDEIALEKIFKDFLIKIDAFLERPLNFPLRETPYKPYISVIIPVRNREKFIGKALESLLENDFEDWECIVVDNASDDNTPNIVEKFSRADKRIKLVRVKNKSLSACLNEGIRRSRGWIVCQLDSDDFYSKDALRTVFEYHREYPVALAISYYDVVDEEGKPLNFPTVKHLEFSINNILRVEGAGALRSYKREALERVGGFDEENFPDFGEDYDLVLKLTEIFQVGRIHKVLYYYRRHPQSTDAQRPLLYKKFIKNSARKSAFLRRRMINFSKRSPLK
jgi:GT2 family glycosyltransferase